MAVAEPYTPSLDYARDQYAGARHLNVGTVPAYEEFDRMIAEVERAAAEKALRDAADALDDGEDREVFKNRTAIAPNGWTDGSISTALEYSGVITDWLRNRAAALGLTAGQERDNDEG